MTLAPGADALVARAREAFVSRFGRDSTLGAIAPGRVNLIGEHTDYNNGFVLPMAIDRWCVCAADERDAETSRICAHDIGETVEVSLAECARFGPARAAELPMWARYVVGALVERASGLGLALGELDLIAVSTVPVGGGLSSSAAIETACAILVEEVAVRDGAHAVDVRSRMARALDCQRAEHRWAGVPCGLMDQLASSFGRAGCVLRIDCAEHEVVPVQVPASRDAVFLVINSGVRHTLASTEYAKRREACERAAAALGVQSLREIERFDGLAAKLPDEQARAVRHVVGENDRVHGAVRAMRTLELEELGRLMGASHRSLRDDYRVSCEELDVIVQLAEGTPGVYGARMTGGGFGGCAVALSAPTAAARVAEGLPPAYLERTGRACDVWLVTPVEGAAALA